MIRSCLSKSLMPEALRVRGVLAAVRAVANQASCCLLKRHLKSLQETTPLLSKQGLYSLPRDYRTKSNSVIGCFPSITNAFNRFNSCFTSRGSISFYSTTKDANPGGVSLNQKDYTNNAFAALANVVNLAESYQAPQIESELLLKSLLEEGPDGLAHRILTKSKSGWSCCCFFPSDIFATLSLNLFIGDLDVNSGLLPQLETFLSQQPRISSATTSVVGDDAVHRPMGATLSNVLRKANQLRHTWKDDFISSTLT